ncbi:hypothetical protein CEXT_388761 [Caerostris extrusa]|uniref:Uncharacterized protein n=1 Tax=Caerostris extrusa TaxID=172846 RepID=A0AAV4YGI4_CAEEX|nr:hypothetical protein CEXT_388761 [Caerostris extrusa]
MLLLFSRVGPQSEWVFGDFFLDQVSEAIVVGVRMKNRDSGGLNWEWCKFARMAIRRNTAFLERCLVATALPLRVIRVPDIFVVEVRMKNRDRGGLN